MMNRLTCILSCYLITCLCLMSTKSYLLKAVAPKRSMTNYPPSEYAIVPGYFQHNGTVTVTGIVCHHWIWLSGGRTREEPIKIESWDTSQNKPIQYQSYRPASKTSKTSVKLQRYFGLFEPGTPDPEKFVLPPYCKKELEKFPKPVGDGFFESRGWIF